LGDPQTNEIRYVGKTTQSLRRRFLRHMATSDLKGPTHKNNWVKSLLKQGLAPILDVLEECVDVTSMNEAERFWIAYLRYVGARLTNATDGGDGLAAGSKRPAAVVEKIRRALKGRPKSEEHKRKISETKRGVPVSKATRKKMRAGQRRSRGIVDVKPLAYPQPRYLKRGLAISRGKGTRPIVDQHGHRYETQAEVARAHDIDSGSISRHLRGQLGTVCGLVLRYVDA
jgi:hypothetical protein